MLRGSQPLPMQANNISQLMFVLRGANMATTADQAFTKQGLFTNYVVTNIIAVCKTGTFGVACIGGIYTAANKGGDAILSAAQVWTGLTGAGTSALAPVSNLFSKSESATPFLSLTTANTGALTADFFIEGVVVD